MLCAMHAALVTSVSLSENFC